jgi:hypothetical protein
MTNDLGEAENKARATRADTLKLCEAEPVTSVSEYPSRAQRVPDTSVSEVLGWSVVRVWILG